MILCTPVAAQFDNMDEIKQRGFSEESLTISKEIDRLKRYISLPLSLSWKQSVLGDVDGAFIDCSMPDWDGYNAKPISESSFWATKFLVQCLPLKIKEPEVVTEPSGQLTLLWQEGTEKIFSLSAYENKLVFAGLFGGDIKFGGVTRFADGLDKQIKDLLQKYFSEK